MAETDTESEQSGGEGALDALEEKEWVESLDYVIKHGGSARVRELLLALQRRAAVRH